MNLSSLFPNTQTKIAAVAPAATSQGDNAARARAEIDAALQATTLKTAGVQAPPHAAPAAGPTGDLEKVAEEIKKANHERRVREAFAEGEAHCDGFMSRLALYEKVAAEQAPWQPANQKTAAEHTEQEVVTQIHKVASAHYLEGYGAARMALQ